MIVVGIVDYGAGNIRSIENAFDHVGASTRKIVREEDGSGVTHLVLPGVGSFGFCKQRLVESGLVPLLERWAIFDRRPLLGICVGMQLLAEESEEHGRHEGLGWIRGRVRPIPGDGARVRIPHVGWNDVCFERSFGRFATGQHVDFYFDHSFALFGYDESETVATCRHGVEFAVVAKCDNIVASQFHPEKSQDAGLDLIKGFLDLSPC